MTDVTERLEELRAALRDESISWGELHELQTLGENGHIPDDDVELREAAGLPEFPDDDGDKVETISGTITLRDGSTSEFSIDMDYGWSQWGATEDRLYKTVRALEVMSEALALD